MHQDCITTLSVSKLGPQPMATQIHPPNQPSNNNNNNNPPANNKKNITVVVPYMPNTGEKFRKLCKKKGIQVHFKGTNILRTALGNPKDKDPQNNQTGIIYHYQCPQINCLSAYIGESGRSLGERVKEHFNAASPIHLHSTTTGHPMDPEHFNIVQKRSTAIPGPSRGHVYPCTGPNPQQEPWEIPATSHMGPPAPVFTNLTAQAFQPSNYTRPLPPTGSPTHLPLPYWWGAHTVMVSTHICPQYTPYTPNPYTKSTSIPTAVSSW